MDIFGDDFDRILHECLGETPSYKGISYFREYVHRLGPLLPTMSLVVELGVAEGASLLAFAELCPRARCLGVDRERPQRIDAAIARLGLGDRVDVLVCDHEDPDRIAAHLGGKPDLIVDDGSHLLEPTRRCLRHLFPELRPGGYYAIEDWGAGYWESHGGPDAGVHRLLYEIIDELAAWDRSRAEPSLPIAEMILTGDEPIALLRRSGTR